MSLRPPKRNDWPFKCYVWAAILPKEYQHKLAGYHEMGDASFELNGTHGRAHSRCLSIQLGPCVDH